jgi:hypothetical protein
VRANPAFLKRQGRFQYKVKEAEVVFHKGQKVEVFRRSQDDSWEAYMDSLVGRHGIITDPDMLINDPDALVEVSLEDMGTFRLPQDCLRALEE